MRKNKEYGFEDSTSNDPLYLDLPEVTFTDPISRKTRTLRANGFPQYPTIAKAILSAFYRISYKLSFSSLPSRWHDLKIFFKFLEHEQVRDELTEITVDLFDRFLPWIQTYKGRRTGRTLATKSAYNAYKLAESLGREVLRTRGKSLQRRQRPIPGVSRAGTHKAHIETKSFARLLSAAKRDVRDIWDKWLGRDTLDPESPLGVAVAYFKSKHGGVVPPKIMTSLRTNSQMHWALQQCGGLEPASRRLHATIDMLTPFMILVAFHTVANAMAVQDFERDCMEPDILLDDTYRIRWWKGRSNQEQTSTRSDSGFYSAPSLIRMVLEFTDPLVKHCAEYHRNKLFLVRGAGKGGAIGAPSWYMWSDAVIRFLSRHNLVDHNGKPLSFSLDKIRPTVLADLFRRTGRPELVRRVANHKYLQTTWDYVIDPLTNDFLDAAIASAQGRLRSTLQPRTRTKAAQTDSKSSKNLKAQGPANDCINPLEGAAGTKPGELCPAWLHPFNDPSLIIPAEPKYLAEVLRHRTALHSIKAITDSKKFAQVYAPVLRIIDDDILPKFSRKLLALARALAASLPPLPVFADE